MTIEQLPTFTIQQIAGDRVVGSFVDKIWIGERHRGSLLLPGDRLIDGRFVNVDLSNQTATFIADNLADPAYMDVGATYRRLDGYWGERAALVLDRERSWNPREFEPVNAVISKGTGFFVLAKSASQAPPDGGAMIEGGWDHEHCGVCWQTISPQAEEAAMFSEPDQWVCLKCYETYVIPRSLDFINIDQAGG